MVYITERRKIVARKNTFFLKADNDNDEENDGDYDSYYRCDDDSDDEIRDMRYEDNE